MYTENEKHQPFQNKGKYAHKKNVQYLLFTILNSANRCKTKKNTKISQYLIF